MELYLKFRKNKFTMTRGRLTATLSLVSSSNHLSSTSSTSLRSGFRKCLILYHFCSNSLIILVLFLQNCLDHIIYQIKFATHARFLISIFHCRINLTFPSTLKTFLLFVTVAMLLLYQSAVNCSSRDAERSFSVK
jgi:hypothetical protein